MAEAGRLRAVHTAQYGAPIEGSTADACRPWPWDRSRRAALLLRAPHVSRRVERGLPGAGVTSRCVVEFPRYRAGQWSDDAVMSSGLATSSGVLVSTSRAMDRSER